MNSERYPGGIIVKEEVDAKCDSDVLFPSPD
jgi:hypothetical protein